MCISRGTEHTSLQAVLQVCPRSSRVSVSWEGGCQGCRLWGPTPHPLTQTLEVGPWRPPGESDVCSRLRAASRVCTSRSRFVSHRMCKGPGFQITAHRLPRSPHPPVLASVWSQSPRGSGSLPPLASIRLQGLCQAGR